MKKKYKLKVLNNNKFYQDYKKVIDEFISYQDSALPLSAAENIISEFSKEPLTYGLQERYILGGHLNYIEDENMIGSNKLLPLYKIINEQCDKLFGAYYTDCRSLSGMNALQNILLTLVNSGDTILLLSPNSGGHAALPNILKRMQVKYIEIPYDYNLLQIDYDRLNYILKEKKIKYILLAPTDILYLPDFSKINLLSDTTIIYDASQVLAFYINNQKNNPLMLKSPVVLMGGTHKTIPGVAKALIMTNDEKIARKIDITINPLYLRNTHIQNVASLILTLIEMEFYAEDYCKNMRENSEYLGKKLTELGFKTITNGKQYSETHQIFINMEKVKRNQFYHLAFECGISLNKKDKDLFKGSGIRIGVQEITRYGWEKVEMDEVAQILRCLYLQDIEDAKLRMKELCGKKNIQYTF